MFKKEKEKKDVIKNYLSTYSNSICLPIEPFPGSYFGSGIVIRTISFV